MYVITGMLKEFSDDAAFANLFLLLFVTLIIKTDFMNTRCLCMATIDSFLGCDMVLQACPYASTLKLLN